MTRQRLLREIRLVVVSPGDVAPERDALRQQIDEVNRDIADYGLALKLWAWETDSGPGLHSGGPQGLIDEEMQIADADIVVAIFWKRFGTPVADAGSGTAHELMLAWESWQRQRRPDVMIYFCRRPHSPQRADEMDQWREVLTFRDRMPQEQTYSGYTGTAEFADKVRQDLKLAIRRIRRVRDKAERQTATAEQFSAVRGTLRLRIGDCDATFADGSKAIEVDGKHPATLGTAEDDDVLTLRGSAALGVSRRHVQLTGFNAGWTFADVGSRNGTFEIRDDAWVPVPPLAKIPLGSFAQLCLGNKLLIDVEVSPATQRGEPARTPPQSGGVLGARRVRSPELEEVAFALLIPRRADPDSRQSLDVDELALILGRPARDIEAALSSLAGLTEVQVFFDGQRTLADVLALAFPYLVAVALPD